MINIGEKYGCLTVLDSGEEYKTTEVYAEFLEEKTKCLEKRDFLESIKSDIAAIKDYIYKYYPSSSWNYDLKAYTEEGREELDNKGYSFWPKAKETEEEICASFIKNEQRGIKGRISQLDYKLNTRYKCKCKCGKVHYYDETTLENNPRYCFYPVSIANLQYSYSNRAHNANYNKAAKYSGLENVRLWHKAPAGRSRHYRYLNEEEDIDYSLPSEEYCELYNKYKTRELLKKEQKLNEIVAKIPRVYATNYDVDYTGRQYESLHIEECVNDNLESKPSYSFTQQHRKHWHNIVVYKQYKCKCTLCGKEHLVDCSAFGIHPPTEYGYHAYHGYWSNVSCDCHKVSSFQWIVSKILFEAGTNYLVEYSFPDLFVASSLHPLRFDFAILDDRGNITYLIECQGEQHYKAVDEFGGEQGLKKQKEYDELKRSYAKENNINLLEISYKDKKYERVLEILKSNGII